MEVLVESGAAPTKALAERADVHVQRSSKIRQHREPSFSNVDQLHSHVAAATPTSRFSAVARAAAAAFSGAASSATVGGSSGSDSYLSQQPL